MIDSLVLTLAYLEPGNLSSAHKFHALIEICEKSGVVNLDNILNLSLFFEIDKLPVVKSCLVLIIDSISRFC